VKVDVHNHAFPQSAVDLVVGDEVYGIRVADGAVGFLGGRHYASHPLYPSLIDPAAKIAELEAGGLDGAGICAEPSLLQHDVELTAAERMAEAVNRGLADFCRRYPDRLRWMAEVPLQSPERAARVLEQARGEGAVGARSAPRSPLAGRTSPNSSPSGRRPSSSASPSSSTPPTTGPTTASSPTTCRT